MILDDYLGLLPSASAQQPNFVALLSAFLQPFVDVQDCMLGMPSDFDIDNAVSIQLDKVGERVGLSRNLPGPITGVYFSIGVAGVGLGEGVLRGPFDPVDALTALDDATYRLVMKIKVRANSWDGSLEQAQEMLAAIQSDGTYIFMQDGFDMTALIGVSGKVPSKLFVSLLKQMKDWLRPSAVALSTVYVTGTSGAPLFGIGVQNSYVAGIGAGALAVLY